MTRRITIYPIITLILLFSSHFIHANHSAEPGNFHQVTQEIYRSSQPNTEQLSYIEQKYNIQSVLNLRQNTDDEFLLPQSHLQFINVAMNADHIDNDAVITALRVIHNAPKPMLIHCRHGSDRTGLMVAMYRMVFQGWSKEQAIQEMKEPQYQFHNKQNIVDYIQQANIEQIRKQLTH